ncbi:MAG TPA: TonB-dependent receptor [Steroidobacteraceae bacterium]|jgi:TonB-dependent receptor|nr:TonB-dependent receptor [Steroidobacteraceae bacterium]
MSRKSRRNTFKSAAKAERTLALRLPYSTLGLSSLALSSMAIAGALHAQDAAPAKDANANANATKPKPAPTAQQGKSLRSKVTRLATSGTLPANGAGLLAQNDQSASATAAQNQTTAGPAESSANQLQEIVVTGIRGSLQRGLEIKKQSLGVVDAMSAEQIGQFPDSDIGEAVARLPGVTVNRGSLNYASAAGAPTATGRVQGLNVDGFGGSFNEVLVEGRQIASGNGQTFNFSDFGSTYVGEIDVLKTPDMSLSSGNIASTTNVKFPNPFDNPGLHIRGFYQEDMNSNAGQGSANFGALWSDTSSDGKFGVLLDGDYMDDKYKNQHQDIVGWKGNTAFACSSLAGNFTTAFGSTGCPDTGAAQAAIDAAALAANPNYVAPNSKVPVWYPQDMAMYLEYIDSRRKDARASVQWRPIENVLVTVDDNYSSDDEHRDRYQRSTWFGGFPDATLDNNGTIVNFMNPGPTDLNSFVSDEYTVTNTPGINVLWDVNDDWTAEFDGDISESQYNPNGDYTDIDADTGFGNTINEYTGGLVLNNNSNVLPYWSAVGPNVTAGGSGATISSNVNGLNPFIIGSHVLPIAIQENTDKITEAKLDATWHGGSTKVNFGAQYIDDLWSSSQWSTFQNNYWQIWGGYGPASDPNAPASSPAQGVPLPASLFSTVSTGSWMPGYSGQGNLPGSLVAYNPYAVLNYLLTQPADSNWKPNPGYSVWNGANNGMPIAFQPGSQQNVDRKNYSPFVVITHDFGLGDMSLNTRLGLRYQKTDEVISGIAAPLVAMAWQGASDPTAYAFGTGTNSFTTIHKSYSYFLPALDLNLMVTPSFKVRFDVSRTESAPPNGSLIPNTTYGGRVNALGATGNNPDLMPYESTNLLLGAEWYYAPNDYLSAESFFKDVKNFPTSSIVDITVPGINDPAPCSYSGTATFTDANCGKPAVFSESTVTNSGKADVDGIEVTWQQMLWLGFGMQINGTYVHTNGNFNNYSLTSNQFAVTGLGNSANFIGFYQAHGFQARLAVQWQGNQLLTLGQEQGGAAFGNEPVYLAAATELDFSTQYDINSHLSAYFQANNLTDSIYRTYGRFSNQTLNLINYGRDFSLGVRAKF